VVVLIVIYLLCRTIKSLFESFYYNNKVKTKQT